MKAIPRLTIMKLLKISFNEKNLKRRQKKKRHMPNRETYIKMKADFLSETIKPEDNGIRSLRC